MTKTQQLLALCEAATPLSKRLKEISYAIAETNWRELSMRVPADPERDADLVTARASVEIERLNAEIKRMVEVMLVMREALSFYMTPPIGQLNDHHIEAAKRGVAAIAAFDEFNNAKSEPTAPLLAQVSSTDGLGVARIAELEAELEKALWLATDKQIALAALRKRIADAPVVADVSSWWNGGTGFDLCNFKGKRPEPGAKLIIKEDLL